MTAAVTCERQVQAAAPAWGPVFAMSLCVFVLIASEFMPVSLLSPIAHDLGLSEGLAGQAISVSGVLAWRRACSSRRWRAGWIGGRS